jgi:hypothetical protein
VPLVLGREPKPAGLGRRVLRILVTLLLVYVTVVVIGRGMQRFVLGAP